MTKDECFHFVVVQDEANTHALTPFSILFPSNYTSTPRVLASCLSQFALEMLLVLKVVRAAAGHSLKYH